MFDAIVVGGGPAGLTASLNLLRSGKSVLILERDSFGGQIAKSPRVENIPSIKEISGIDLANNIFEQVTSLGAEFELEEVLEIKKDHFFSVKTNYNTYEAKVVIIASGVKNRHLPIENETDFIGKGISYCAVCDGAFYKGEEVGIVGDANTALQYSLLLTNYCKKVHVYTLFDKFFADKCLVDQLLSKDNVVIKHNMNAKEIIGTDKLEAMVFENTKTHEINKLNVSAVFVAIGQIPDNERYANVVELNKGFISVNSNFETKTAGLYAIGDCIDKKFRQVVTAENDGAIAAFNANFYIEANY